MNKWAAQKGRKKVETETDVKTEDPLGIKDVVPGGTPIAPVMYPSKYLSPVTQKRIATRQLEERIIGRMDELVDAAFGLALGVSVEGDEGKIYQKPPDRETIKMLWERGLGKPTENVNITVNGKDLYEAEPEELALALAQEGITAEEIEAAELDED
jgi:hypothetical protein